VRRLTATDLGVDTTPQVEIQKVYQPRHSKQVQVLEGPAKDVAAKLVEKLRFEARVL
jgi:electron transfer flavoprotein beta subunit